MQSFSCWQTCKDNHLHVNQGLQGYLKPRFYSKARTLSTQQQKWPIEDYYRSPPPREWARWRIHEWSSTQLVLVALLLPSAFEYPACRFFRHGFLECVTLSKDTWRTVCQQTFLRCIIVFQTSWNWTQNETSDKGTTFPLFALCHYCFKGVPTRWFCF